MSDDLLSQFLGSPPPLPPLDEMPTLSDTAAIDRCLRWLALRTGAGVAFGAPGWVWVPSWCAGGGRWELDGALTFAFAARPWVPVRGHSWGKGWHVLEGLPEPADAGGLATREEQLAAFVHVLRWAGRQP